MSINNSQIDAGVLIRRSLFFLVLVILTLGNLFTLFKGLNTPQAMDQAQIAREIARGNGFTTKFIRPVAYNQVERAEEGAVVPLEGFQDTYHAPLNPLLNAAVLKLIGADDPTAWQMGENELIYRLDRVIAAVSTMCFLMAIGVTYLLVSRIFDAKIAGITAILMLFCQSFWDYSLSGLPQMLMLLLFTCGLYFAYRAVEAASEDRIAMTPAVVAGVFFTLLALTHWMTVWIALGYIVFAAFTFRPRGVVALIVFALIVMASIGPIIRNLGITDTPFGTAYLTIYNGLGDGSEDVVMRNVDLETQPLQTDGLLGKVVRTTLLQMSDIVPLLGGIIIAPLFFLSLLHPFKRQSIAMFRWAVLLMWVFAALGLAFFGITTDGLDPNQIHLVFAPIMVAYGLAFISILWNRLEFVASTPMLRELHLIVVVVVCALPLALSLPPRVKVGLMLRDRGGAPQWPPYYALGLNSATSGIKRWVGEENVVFSDQPWAVAWYADRMSIWLPPTREGFEKFETIATNLQNPTSGILITPSSHGSGPISEVAQRFGDFAALVYDGRILAATYPPGMTIFDKTNQLESIARRYPYRKLIVGTDMVYYGDRPMEEQN
jgi:hypothetical protein